MIRRALVERFQLRFEELVLDAPAAAVAYAQRELPRFTPEETALVLGWFKERGDEEFRKGEEAIERAIPPAAPSRARRELLARGYAFYETLRGKLTGERGEPMTLGERLALMTRVQLWLRRLIARR